ncbi:MAG: hypothetical protein K0Q49_1483 [Haloplasmataceae bacterium]|jgi:hypothetical protein|nr:hypothetical protein [Haloplasmataceae bacterium]
MGSYISLGFVFQNDKEIKDSLKQLLKLLNNKNSPIIYKVCFDLSEDNWLERKINYNDIIEDDFNNLTNYFYSNIKLNASFLGFDLLLNITIYKDEDFYGFLIDLFEDYFKISYLDLEDSLINFVNDIYSKLKFDYAFGEHDGEIEFSPNEIIQQNVNYCLLFLKDNKDSLQILKGDHLLDGLTTR